MKKIGLISMVLVVAMGMLGVGYAMWSETLTITGTVETGDVDVEFSDQMPNDSAVELDDLTTGDPAAIGSWTYTDIGDTSTWSWTGAVQDDGAEYKEVASIDCVITSNLIEVTILNGYPCYFGNVAYTIDNLGSIPVKIYRIELVSLGGATLTTPIAVTAGEQWYVDMDATTPTVSLTPAPATGDFSFVISTIAIGDQIGAAGWDDDALFGDIGIHVEQDADEALTTNAYSFGIEIECAQWNEVN